MTTTAASALIATALEAGQIDKHTPAPWVARSHTPGPWGIVKTFNGYRITRTWSSGLYQVLRGPWLRTEEAAIAALAEVSA